MSKKKFCSNCGERKDCCCKPCGEGCASCVSPKPCPGHCWHHPIPYTFTNNITCYNGYTRRCCFCGIYEYQLHGPFQPKPPGYTWTTTTIPGATTVYYPNVTTNPIAGVTISGGTITTT